MSCKSLLALSLVGAVVLLLTGSAEADPYLPPVPVCRPVCSPAPVCPPVTNRHTMTIYNGAHLVRQNFVEKNGSWRSCGEFKSYDVFFRDCPRSPWRYHGTYDSFRRADEAACSLSANGKLASVRQRRA